MHPKQFQRGSTPQEQKRIVARVGELMNLCDELEAHLKKKEELGNRLAEAVVAAA